MNTDQDQRRTSVPSIKVAENLEQNQERLQNFKQLLVTDDGQEATARAQEIRDRYDELRNSLGGVMPEDLRRQTDLALQSLTRKTHTSSIVSGSSRRSGSTTSSRRLVLAAERARLEAEEEAKRKEAEQLIKLKEMEAQEMARRAEFEIQMAKLKLDQETERRQKELLARDRELEMLEVEEDAVSSRHSIVKDSNEDTMATLINALRSVSQGPMPEPKVFSGDPLEYTAWKTSFLSLVKQRPVEEQGYLLQKYISGEARDCVEGMFSLAPDKILDPAWKLLEKRYGNAFIIAESFRSKLSDWPNIENSEHKNLRKFSDFLNQCVTAKQMNKGLAILDDPHENKKLLRKLPLWIRRDWMKKAEEMDFSNYPSFEDFAKFIEKIANRVNNPIFQDIQGNKTSESTRKESSSRSKDRPAHQARGLATASEEPVSQDVPQDCKYCSLNNHMTANCRKFRSLQPQERSDFIKEKGLCFGCLAQGHISKQCKDRLVCDICKERHPTCLHGDSTPKKNHDTSSSETEAKTLTSTCLADKQEKSPTCSSVVPVYLSTRNKPEEEVMVYAMLDTQSDTTFVLESTADSLESTESTGAKLKISTMTVPSTINCRRYEGLMIRGINSSDRLMLPATYSKDFIPADKNQIPTNETAKNWDHLSSLKDKIPKLQSCEVGLLIGYNCPSALAPLEVIIGKTSEPYAQKTALGWSIVGCTRATREETLSENCSFVHRTKTQEVSPQETLNALEADFQQERECCLSQDDLKFTEMMNKGIHQDKDGYYEMPLPFRDGHPNMPDNRKSAEIRLLQLKRKFIKNTELYTEYKAFMDKVLERGEAELSPDETSKKWFIPHHGVYHPRKRKLRVVFDCSANHLGASLNDHLLSGPDMINSLIGILCRFREQQVGFTGDIERMFHMFRVDETDRDYLSFLWWKNGDITQQVLTYRMKVHLFGATSSPACASFALRQLAIDHAQHDQKVAGFLTNDFYVDDGLKSTESAEEAASLIEATTAVCRKANIRLHKFVSNNSDVMKSIPDSELATQPAVDFAEADWRVERLLGVQWCIETDEFQFRVILSEKPFTRRGVLSTIASIYDPLGCLAPLVLKGKLLLQTMCVEKLGWDQELSPDLHTSWSNWLEDLRNLEQIKLRRCYKPSNLKEIQDVQLHHFGDASTKGYGQCSYVRIVGNDGTVSCSLVMGKSRVAPQKLTTIPRLELTAAVTSVKISDFLKHQLTYSNITEFFWTDSRAVLGYLANDSRRFHVFVANRVQQIQNLSSKEQWSYVSSQDNPADIASRGASVAQILESSWFEGPDFLKDSTWTPSVQDAIPLQDDDPEVRRITHAIHQPTDSPVDWFNRFSSWKRALRVMARILNITQKKHTIEAADLERSRVKILKLIQASVYGKQIDALKSGRQLPKKDKIQDLNPFINDDGLLCVGGRLKESTSLPEIAIHPVILPAKSHLVKLLIFQCHREVQHQGRSFTMNQIRSCGYWIIGLGRATSSLLFKCVTCRKLRGKTMTQKMADLPSDRLEEVPPFTNCGIDCFGPFLVKDGRKEAKRYGLMVTCLTSRAVHIETLDTLSTDSFLMALRRLIAIRGPIRLIRCDQGSNFVGASRELGENLKKMEESRLKTFLLDQQIEFKFNTPESSHMGGVWERQIRTTRSILRCLLSQHGSRIDSTTLQTFLYEVMMIINNRPLATQGLSDPHEPSILSPSNILTAKPHVALPPPGDFVKQDIYLIKRWKRVQFLLEEFWKKWRKEYMLTLQQRTKWARDQRNMKEGDIVALPDEDLRGVWRMGRIVTAKKGNDGLVRHVTIELGDRQLSQTGQRLHKRKFLERPIHKLKLLLEADG